MVEVQHKIGKIKDILRRDKGIASIVDYTEQISWILLLKFLNDFEETIEDRSILNYGEYKHIFPKELRGKLFNKIDNKNSEYKTHEYHINLVDFVNVDLFNYLQNLKYNSNKESLEYIIGSIFQLLRNKITSERNLREVLEIINSLDFQSEHGIIEARQVYETLLKDLGSDSGKYGGFYTPRPIVRAIIKTVHPKRGNSIYDGAVGSAGFLIEAFEYINSFTKNHQSKDSNNTTFFGQELSVKGYVFGMINMILHGILHPNVCNEDTLIKHFKNSDIFKHYDLIISNPPMGKGNDVESYNFPIETNRMELLFLQHYMMTLKLGGKASIIIPNAVLFDSSVASRKIKQTLLENFNVHTIVSLPNGIFMPYSGVNASIIYFEKVSYTSKIWHYELNLPYSLTKSKPILDEHFEEFIDLFLNPEKRNSGNVKKNNHSNDWTVSVEEIINYNLQSENPNKFDELQYLKPLNILNKLKDSNLQSKNYSSEIELSTIEFVNKKIEKLHWEEIAILQLVEKVKSIDETYNDDIVTYVDLSSINNNNNKIEQPKIINIKDSPQRSKKGALKGDIIFSTVRPELKNIAVITEDYDSLILSSSFSILRPKKERLHHDFLFYYLLSDKFQIQVNRLIKSISIPAISEKDLLGIKIPLPPLQVQIEMAQDIRKVYDKIEKVIDIESEKLTNLKHLKESILRDLFEDNKRKV